MGKQVAAGLNSGLQLSRLERTPDKREVGGSSPLKPTVNQKIHESYLENRISKIKIQASADRKWKHFREAEVMMKIETSKRIKKYNIIHVTLDMNNEQVKLKRAQGGCLGTESR